MILSYLPRFKVYTLLKTRWASLGNYCSNKNSLQVKLCRKLHFFLSNSASKPSSPLLKLTNFGCEPIIQTMFSFLLFWFEARIKVLYKSISITIILTLTSQCHTLISCHYIPLLLTLRSLHPLRSTCPTVYVQLLSSFYCVD